MLSRNRPFKPIDFNHIEHYSGPKSLEIRQITSAERQENEALSALTDARFHDLWGNVLGSLGLALASVAGIVAENPAQSDLFFAALPGSGIVIALAGAYYHSAKHGREAAATSHSNALVILGRVGIDPSIT